jgi:arylsulfotransferase ASST/type IX secretion system substrate protein
MRKKYIFFYFFIILNLPSILSQNTIGTLINSTDAYDGYTLFTVAKSTYLINNCGQVINEWISDNNPGFAVYILPDGSLLRAELINDFDPIIPGKGGLVVIRDWNNNITWQYTFSDAQSAQHHDVFPLQNGNILVLIVERKTMNEAILAGRNPANLIDNELFNEKIIEIKPIGSNGIEIVWEWNAWDHLIQDFDSTKNNFGNVLNKPQLLDINYLGFSNSKANWLHVNSIQYNSVLDQIVLSSRQLNEFYIIDHSTTTQEAATNSGGARGKGGDYLYRWGNPLAYKAGTITDQKLYGQHYPHWIPSGFTDGDKILIFNNGFNRNIEFSSVDIVNPPQNLPGDYIIPVGEKTGPVDFDWTYVDPIDPINFFSKIMASAQRLPNGNTMICEGTEGNFFEIDSNKNIVWNYLIPISPGGILSQGDPPDPSRVFRAFKYSKDDVAFNGKDVTPGDPIELNFDLSGCTTLSVDESLESTFNIFPNPVNDILNIKSSLIIDKVEVFNIQGVLVSESLSQNFINVKNLSSGMYLLKVYSENKIVNKKIIVY